MGTTRWIRALKLLCIMLLLVPLLTGCWDRLEIEERAVVLGISVDEAEPGSQKEEDEVSHLKDRFPAPQKEMVRVAVQIAIPGRIPLGPGESGGGDRGAGKSVWVVDVVGHTIDDALMNLQQQMSGRLFFGHLRVIVVSDAVARKGLQNLNDYFRRNSEVRRMAWLLISKGNAEELMAASPKLERVPTLYLISTMDSAVKMGKFPNDFVGNFWSNSSKKGQEGLLPYVELMKEDNVEISGLAMFKGDKLVGITQPLEIGAYMGIKGMNPAGYRGIISVGGAQNTVTLYATHRKAKIDVQIKNGLPHFTVTILNELNIEEKISDQFLIENPEIIKEIEREDEKAAIKLHEGLVKETQEKGSDIFGFGEYVRAKEPKFWNEQVQTKEHWQEMYKDVSVDVQIDIKVRRVGMKAR
ncbi:Ger(x)C family spore germination protein [Paenibacillus allorhizosphaerae]|uniref:Spore germination protein A3 n=1 Tax=Paenibacillus allorhizosphaerae TaxID=2849866 RepID=A0ABM8VGE5_9BACL|nr:Ger(x)C family spore germination protein [Paenibacillus allorhizosphaerae]CAG7638345.1 Spore germination protein A3 [Paenibacillus allorhizosphaerae]